MRGRLGKAGLRIAVGGRVRAGKSTLINALVGQDVAATAATECTLLVAWFRNGPQNQVVVHRVDGARALAYVGLPGRGAGAGFRTRRPARARRRGIGSWRRGTDGRRPAAEWRDPA